MLALARRRRVHAGGQEQAPDVTFISIKGEKISTQALRGKVVMVNFWATSCTTCVNEMPQMVDTYHKFKDQGLEFVAVAMSYDPPELRGQLHRDAQAAVQGGARFGRRPGARRSATCELTPTTFVIGKDGKILKRYVGEPEFAALHALLQKALSEG